MSDASRTTLWPWLERRYRLSQAQMRPLGRDNGPLLADPSPIVVGDVIDETLAIASAAGIEPAVLLPANDIYYGYDGTVQAAAERVQEDAELVQRFVDATIEGWYRYLYDDNTQVDALIERANPEMTKERLAHALTVIRRYGLVDSSHALSMGIGAMDGGNWVNFWKAVLARSACPDSGQLYTLRFVNQSHGLALKEALAGG